MDLKLVKKIYKGVDNLSIMENCSLTYTTCKKCTQECPARTMLVKRFERVIGWVSEGRINKTNPNPGKQYRRRILGIKKQKWEREKEEW